MKHESLAEDLENALDDENHVKESSDCVKHLVSLCVIVSVFVVVESKRQRVKSDGTDDCLLEPPKRIQYTCWVNLLPLDDPDCQVTDLVVLMKAEEGFRVVLEASEIQTTHIDDLAVNHHHAFFFELLSDGFGVVVVLECSFAV